MEKETKSVKKTASSAKKNTPLAHGVGRRKRAVARVWLQKGKGAVTVNGRELSNYFDTEIARKDAQTPLKIVEGAADYSIKVRVVGGGVSAQAGAVRLGISRALVAVDEGCRSVLRQNKLLTVDARNVERKKPGQRGARRKFQFVKR